MTVAADPDVACALRRAAIRATYAPSVHETQPWRFELYDNRLEVYAEPSLQLCVLDPARRQLTISCGSAVFNARVTLAAAGWKPTVARFPDLAQPTLVARIGVSTRSVTVVVDPVAGYDDVIEVAWMNRRRFSDNDVPAEVIESLESSATQEGAHLVVVRTEDHGAALARLAQHADEVQLLNPVYRAELRAWTSHDSFPSDPMQGMAVVHADGAADADMSMLDFGRRATGWSLAATRPWSPECLLLLCTEQDTPLSWLRAGEALERVLLELTRRGYVASPSTQMVEVPSARAALRRELDLTDFPHILLRAGRAPATPAPRRRRLIDVLVKGTEG